MGSIQHGGRQEIGILGNKSSVRQRSARSSPSRRRRKLYYIRHEILCLRMLFGWLVMLVVIITRNVQVRFLRHMAHMFSIRAKCHC